MTIALILLAVWLVAINLFAFDRMGEDKIRTLAMQRRLPEPALQALALFGGALGVQIGRMVHHNRKDRDFSRRLATIATGQAIVLLIVGWLIVTGA